MKKILLIGIITAVLVLATYFFLFLGPGKARLSESGAKVTALNVKDFNARLHDPALMLAHLKDEGVLIEGSEKLTFTDGEASTAKDQGGFTERSVFTLGKILGVQSAGNGYDIIAEMFADFGGSGTFNSVAVFNTSIDSEYKNNIPPTGRSYKVIGDRIIIDSVVTGDPSDESYDLTVRYYERKEGAAMTDPPTEKTTKTFRVSKSVISEK